MVFYSVTKKKRETGRPLRVTGGEISNETVPTLRVTVSTVHSRTVVLMLASTRTNASVVQLAAQPVFSTFRSQGEKSLMQNSMR